MSCESVDLKSYILGEGTREERGAVKAHAAACARCREELSRLELTRAALTSLREEEVPRRIGFVSDPVFEPNWWQRFWRSGPRLAFAGAAMLSLAVVAHGVLARPAVQVGGSPAPVVDTAALDARVEREVAARMDKAVSQAVARAVAESEQRQQQRTMQLMAAADRKHDLDLRAVQVAFEEDWKVNMKQLGTMYVAMNHMDAGGSK